MRVIQKLRVFVDILECVCYVYIYQTTMTAVTNISELAGLSTSCSETCV